MSKARLLIADDEFNTRVALVRYFKRSYDVEAASDGSSAIALLEKEKFDLVLTDMRMPGADGMEVLAAAKAHGTPTVVLTAYGSIGDAVKAVKSGAFDFVSKPIKLDALSLVIEAALANGGTAVKKSAAVEKAGTTGNLTPVSADDPMKKVYETALAVAGSRASVLLSGESGTGKEVIAKMIHDESHRQGPFVPVHCAALTSTLLESELFGYEKGAFTGANERRIGKFELADQGTLFLDEVGEIDASTQVKLLRVLETRSFERVGGIESVQSDFRLIAATNRDLRKMVTEGTFREDLYYRLSVINLELPPLRERKMMIPHLVEYFTKLFAEENGKPVPEYEPETMKILTECPWHGNIRQLRNCIESMVVLAKNDKLTPADIPDSIRNEQTPKGGKDANSLDIRQSEMDLIEKALQECGGNRTRAAEKLGISRRTLLRRLAEKK